jgi:FlaA1/EpsC-like NDP-sugar epimerase
MSQKWQRILGKYLLDVAVLCGAYGLAFLIRFEGAVPPRELELLTHFVGYVVCLQLLCLAAFRVPSVPWRYAGLPEAERIWLALGVAGCVLTAMKVVCTDLSPALGTSGYGRIPFGVLVIDLVLSFLGVTGLRATTRLWVEWRQRRTAARGASRQKVPTLLIGADGAGALVAKEVAAHPEVGIEPLGFLDDDPHKRGMVIHGLRVLGTAADIERVGKAVGARQALITIENLSGAGTRRLQDLCSRCGISAKVIPGIRDVVEGRISLSKIRDVSIEDLLCRDPVRLDSRAIAAKVASRRIVITGAGGSIGSELCRVVCRFGPAVLVLVEQAENSLFQVHRELANTFPGLRLAPCIADICDGPRMEEIFERWQPEVVFHAAAHKHVPMMEWNPGEAIKNNVFGTRQLADLADAAGVGEFVMISTDKAVNPTSVMGVSKRIAEIYIQALSQRSRTRFVTVRFGNVLGSNGSVIPIFKEQISRGGPVTVTHPEMKRYFMTIPEACQLVLQAASMGQGGEIFVLDMGEPVKIVDLARDLIRLSGLAPEEIEVRFTGLRPGEKLFEELSLKEENARKTHHPKIFIGRLHPQEWDMVNGQLQELQELVGDGDVGAVFRKLKEIVPEYSSPVPSYLDLGSAQPPHFGLAGPHRNGHAQEASRILAPALAVRLLTEGGT